MPRFKCRWLIRISVLWVVVFVGCDAKRAADQEAMPASTPSAMADEADKQLAPAEAFGGVGRTGGGKKLKGYGPGRPRPSKIGGGGLYESPTDDDGLSPGEPAALIDPNGRFATTYRPGGGHLAAFESAVARGIIPAAEREVVSDVGARYWSAVPEPKTTAVAVQSDFERTALRPSGGPLHLRLSLRSSSKSASGRARLSVHLVLDVSGSMAGAPIKHARTAAQQLVDKLAPNDDFSLVTFSSNAEVRIKDGLVGPRKAAIKKTIAQVVEGGGTNIGEGLQLAYEQATSKTIPADAVRVVLLLSDGRANAGITSRSRLSKLALDAFQNRIQTSTFGLGSDYDGALMSAIASDGAGGYYYLRDSEQIAAALGTELNKRLNPVATAVELRLRLKKDVGLMKVYGSRRLTEGEAARVRAVEVAADKHAEARDKIKRDRQDDPKGGMRFFIPAFARDDNHAMLLKLKIPAGVGKRQVAVLELKYKDRLSKKNVVEEHRISVEYANSDADSAKSIQPSVARTVQGFEAGEVLLKAAYLVSAGDRTRAIALLSEREQILRTAAKTLNEPGFNRDADRLARLRTHTGASSGMGEPMVLAMLLETAGRSHLH